MLVLQQLTQETAPLFDLIGTGCHIFSFQCCIHLLKMSLAAVAKQRPVHYGTVVSSCAVHPQDDIRTRGVRLVRGGKQTLSSIQNLSPLGEELMEWHTCRQSTRKCETGRNFGEKYIYLHSTGTQISREKRFHNLVRKGLVFDWWQTNSIS
ncbi:hypothetical protein ACLB2K_055788 [Fragaria x ananassa]